MRPLQNLRTVASTYQKKVAPTSAWKSLKAVAVSTQLVSPFHRQKRKHGIITEVNSLSQQQFSFLEKHAAYLLKDESMWMLQLSYCMCGHSYKQMRIE